MAMTETRPGGGDDDTAEAATSTEPDAVTRRVGGLSGLLGGGDHKAVGRLFIAASLLFLVVTAGAGGALSVERTDTGSLDLLEDSYGQVFSLHSVGAVFLFLLPMLLGLAISIVPLQIGARTIAFPRAAAAAFWTWLLAGGLVVASYAINGGPSGGDANGVDLWTVSMAVVVAALCLATVCVVTTAFTLRTSGMGLDRAPHFTWSMVVGGSVWLLTLPACFGLLIVLYVDTHYGAGLLGGLPRLYDRLAWGGGPPRVYAYAVPALGIIGDIVPVFARTRGRSHDLVLGLIAATGALGIGAWTLLRSNEPELVEQFLFVAMALLVVVPLLALAGIWADTLRRGQVRLASPLLFALAAGVLVVAGAVAGAVAVIDPFELRDTTWGSGHLHYVLGGTAIAAVGGLHYWSTKIFGRALREGLARLTALLLLSGVAVLSAFDLISGVLDQDRGSLRSESGGPVSDSIETLNIVALAGGALVTLGVLVFLANLVASLAQRAGDGARGAPADPWDGHTLEWATASPPDPGNFGEIDLVRSPAPLLDAREAKE
ncbi:cytochrome c oxidase subunit I [soil metagenome]